MPKARSLGDASIPRERRGPMVTSSVRRIASVTECHWFLPGFPDTSPIPSSPLISRSFPVAPDADDVMRHGRVAGMHHFVTHPELEDRMEIPLKGRRQPVRAVKIDMAYLAHGRGMRRGRDVR